MIGIDLLNLATFIYVKLNVVGQLSLCPSLLCIFDWSIYFLYYCSIMSISAQQITDQFFLKSKQMFFSGRSQHSSHNTWNVHIVGCYR